MEVRSPGSLLSSLSIADLKELQGAHQSRNVFIARVMRELGYMREMGEGIRRIFRSVRESELVDPEIRTGINSFSITLFYQSIFAPQDVQWLNGYEDFSLNKQEQRVVLLGRDGNLISTQQIFDTLELVDTEDFRALQEQLRQKGLIYSAKEKARRNPRRQPRYRVRSPLEVQQHLSEIQTALLTLGSASELARDYIQNLQGAISPDNPYRTNTLRSLRVLGYVDFERQPLPKLRSLWANAFSQAERSNTTDGRRAQTRTAVRTGEIVLLKGNYGFIRDNEGETYYLHKSELEHPFDWNEIRKGALVEFQVGQRSIQKRDRPATKVRVT